MAARTFKEIARKVAILLDHADRKAIRLIHANDFGRYVAVDPIPEKGRSNAQVLHFTTLNSWRASDGHANPNLESLEKLAAIATAALKRSGGNIEVTLEDLSDQTSPKDFAEKLDPRITRQQVRLVLDRDVFQYASHSRLFFLSKRNATLLYNRARGYYVCIRRSTQGTRASNQYVICGLEVIHVVPGRGGARAIRCKLNLPSAYPQEAHYEYDGYVTEVAGNYLFLFEERGGDDAIVIISSKPEPVGLGVCATVSAAAHRPTSMDIRLIKGTGKPDGDEEGRKFMKKVPRTCGKKDIASAIGDINTKFPWVRLVTRGAFES